MRRIFLLMILIGIAASTAEIENGDNSPPHSYVESMYGWHDHSVILKLIAQDELSGIAAVSYMIDGGMPVVSYSPETWILIDTEGVHRIEYSSMDNAGNTEEIKTSQVKLDLTAPVINIAAPVSRAYLHSDIVRLNFSATDALSGIFSMTAGINGIAVTHDQEFDMLNLRPGKYEFIATAHDNAGNTGISGLNFTVISDIYSLIALNRRGMDNGWITDNVTYESLNMKLVPAMQYIEAGQREMANNLIKSYLNEIEAEKGKNITWYGADILTTEAAYVYISTV